jgi:hypothetical protein
MIYYTKPALRGNGRALTDGALPLFEWTSHRRVWPHPVAVIARRHRLPLATASVVAELAGLGGRADA